MYNSLMSYSTIDTNNQLCIFMNETYLLSASTLNVYNLIFFLRCMTYLCILC